jgi:hypothetical protein
VSVGFLSLLHAELEGEAGEGFLCGVLAEPRPLFLGDPASSFHPCFALWAPLEGVSIFHDLILAFNRFGRYSTVAFLVCLLAIWAGAVFTIFLINHTIV